MKTFIKLNLRKMLLMELVGCAFFTISCEKPKESAMSCLMRAREEYNIYAQFSQSVKSRQKKSYALYKTVFLNNRALMTYKNIAQMYQLAVYVEKDQAFLKKIRTVYESERKIAKI